jgi:APA family basic amino acid/polyamine antiporter
MLSFIGALIYGEIGAMRPEAGGIYVYIRDAFGKLPAFLYGWTLFFAMSNGALAVLSIAGASYMNQIVPLSRSATLVVALSMILILAVVNILGTRKSIGLQNWTTAVKAGAIVLMSVALLLLGKGLSSTYQALWPASFSLSLLSDAGVALISVLWAYEGWQYVTSAAGEVIDPQRNFARGFAWGTALLAFLYVLANLAYLAALGPQQVAQSDRVAAEAVGLMAGPFAGKLIAAAIMISMFSAANAVMLTTTRVFFAMARDGVFFHKLAALHPRFDTPAYAVIFSTAWAIMLLLSGTFEHLLTYVVFTGWIFYALAAASIFIYRRRESQTFRPFHVPGYPWTPLLFVVIAAIFVGNTIISQPRQSLLGLLVVLAGVPVFFFWQARTRRRDPAAPKISAMETR